MAFGVEIYNASGNTVLSYTSRVPRFSLYGTTTITGTSNTNVTVIGMQNNDSWDVFLDSGNLLFRPGAQTVTVTLNTDFFTIRNFTTTSANVFYWVLRS
jgi:hypothetical protein